MNDNVLSARDKILRSLNAGGYPLEMRVAAQARRYETGYVRQSIMYPDPVTGKLRETDVVVHWRAVLTHEKRMTDIKLVIECKSKPRPWVVFDSNRPGFGDSVTNMLMTPQLTDRADDDWLEDRFESYMEDPERPATLFTPTEFGLGNGIVEVSFDGDDRGAEPNKAWSAVQSATSAAHGLLARSAAVRAAANSRTTIVDTIVIPVVVTSGLLFRCWLDENDSLDATEIDRASVVVQVSPDTSGARCLVITEAALPALLRDAAATVDVFR